MRKIFILLTTLFFLNGCAESVALFGTSVGGASSGKVLQSSLTSSISLGVKHKTGKTPVGHVLSYVEEKNPERKKEKCISFIEKTRSEFCTIAKKQISSTNKAVKQKVIEVAKKYPNTEKIKNIVLEKKDNLININQKKSPRRLAITIQSHLKKRR